MTDQIISHPETSPVNETNSTLINFPSDYAGILALGVISITGFGFWFYFKEFRGATTTKNKNSVDKHKISIKEKLKYRNKKHSNRTTSSLSDSTLSIIDQILEENKK